MEALDITVRGIVQGVGFRPFVYRAAQSHHLTGWVLNAVEGVHIHVEGSSSDIDQFVMEVHDHAPAAAHIREMNLDESSVQGFDDFSIRLSDDSETVSTTNVSPDLATCDECVAELFDPTNRRYHYPFINCTNCGPRFTIVNDLPYDRPLTSMVPFTMCPQCQDEYDNPADRRFHAQPDACFECGPHLGWALSGQGIEDIEWAYDLESSDRLIDRAVNLLRAGSIVAIKGLGGYHLACDASNSQALITLRQRKRREGKAFAIMVATVDDACQFGRVSKAEAEQMTSPARPIVLLRKRPDVAFAPGLADKLPEIGIMLPSTPLQHLIVRAFDGPLVMTSANLHDEPIVTTEEEALDELSQVADAFLVNDRAIVSRYDDSVVRLLDAGTAGEVVQFVRRARGYAPVPLKLPVAKQRANQCVLAVGPEQKNTFTLAEGDQAFCSQHIGDMEDARTFDSWISAVERYQKLFRRTPIKLIHDLHPEYLTTKWAVSQNLPMVGVQHHFAHILSVMGENELAGPVCGIAFDGTGYGADGAIWGGEVLLANLQAYERFANFAYFPLPGGAAAVKQPLRGAYGILWACDLLNHPGAKGMMERLGSQAELFDQMIEKGLNCPMTSSVGRLFDAVAALTGICSEPTYQGEAAILLEAAVHQGIAEGFLDSDSTDAYRIDVIKNTATEHSTAQDTSVVLFDPAPLFEGVLDDLAAGENSATIAQKFHTAFVKVVLQAAQLIYNVYGVTTVTLSGGVFLNRYLTERCLKRLIELGFTVAVNRELPPSDGAISYGQAVFAQNTLVPEQE